MKNIWKYTLIFCVVVLTTFTASCSGKKYVDYPMNTEFSVYFTQDLSDPFIEYDDNGIHIYEYNLEKTIADRKVTIIEEANENSTGKRSIQTKARSVYSLRRDNDHLIKCVPESSSFDNALNRFAFFSSSTVTHTTNEDVTIILSFRTKLLEKTSYLIYKKDGVMIDIPFGDSYEKTTRLWFTDTDEDLWFGKVGRLDMHEPLHDVPILSFEYYDSRGNYVLWKYEDGKYSIDRVEKVQPKFIEYTFFSVEENMIYAESNSVFNEILSRYKLCTDITEDDLIQKIVELANKYEATNGEDAHTSNDAEYKKWLEDKLIELKFICDGATDTEEG